MKGLCILCMWISLLILSELQYSVTNSCLHDVIDVDNSVVPEQKFTSEEFFRQRVKRQAPKTNSSWSRNSIRIRPVYFLSKHLLEQEKLALQNVLQRAINKIQSLLSVLNSVKHPLLLERKAACPIVLGKGVNKGKCSRIPKRYRGEYCLDNTKIPFDHLKGVSVFNKTSPDPVQVFKKDGPGLSDTDFVLYVTSNTTVLCNPYKSSALAYAAACQLDDSGRPIAGQVNFCPRTLKEKKFDSELLYKTAIHELFHALGFSSKLFEKFVSCDQDGKCDPIKQPLIQSVGGFKRLVTPAVVREMRRHFKCDAELDFGGPLQVVNGKVSSHWDPILMHSSIMTAREQKPYLTLIDPITLAVFEDSGWYRVDYSQADPFIWGKGKGCKFGTQQKCTEENGLCSMNSTGCHHRRLSKAKCNANPSLHPSGCGVYAADQRPCFLANKEDPTNEEETYSSNSRCFLSSLVPLKGSHNSQKINPKETRGRCYETKCEANKVYVRVQNEEWRLCHPGSKLQVDKFAGFIKCPPALEVCSSFHISDVPLATPTTSPLYFMNNNSKSIGHSRPVRSGENNRRLYADIKVSKSLNDYTEGSFTSALGKSLKKNRLLVYRLDTTWSSGKTRFCLTVGVREGDTISFKTLRKLLYKDLSTHFNGYYDRYTKIDVLSSDKYFCNDCKVSSIYANWSSWRDGAANVNRPSLFWTAVIVGLIWIMMIYP